MSTITVCYSTNFNGVSFTCEEDAEWQSEQAQDQLDEGRDIVGEVMENYCDEDGRLKITKDAASQKIATALYHHFPEHNVEVIFDDMST